jgi:tetratricopeptide (TPR) repeat protein
MTATALALVVLLAGGSGSAASGVPGASAEPPGPAPSRPATPEDAATRRHAVQALRETGTMRDLPALARALRDPDPIVRALAENAMWEVWSRSGDEEIDHLLLLGSEEMRASHLGSAVEIFTRIIERRPDFAEGWNKRATAYFLLGEHRKSLADCDEVMKRNPYHFGALSGYGMIYLQLDQPARALEYFERALRVNPNLAGVEEAAATLRRLLRERRRDII